MTSVQPAFDALQPKKRAPRTVKPKIPAQNLPVARVVLDIQAAHLGQAFDYLIEEKDSEVAQPGVEVRVRFGGQRVNGIVWERAERAVNPSLAASLRYIEKVLSPLVVVDAQMRRDIEAIAQGFGGTLSNILRVAIPRRVARVEKEWGLQSTRTEGSNQLEQSHIAQQQLANRQMTNQLLSEYEGMHELVNAFDSSRHTSFVWDSLPGITWVRDIVWCVQTARQAGRGVVVCLPTHRAVTRVMQALEDNGIEIFRRTGSAGSTGDSPMVAWRGDVAVLDSSTTIDERYRAYLALSTGKVTCVVGTRAAMYAPVRGNAVFVVMDDIAYQNSDGFVPYANVRDVLRLRAHEHSGIFIAMGRMRSPESEYEVVDSVSAANISGGIGTGGMGTVPQSRSKQIHGFSEVVKQLQPQTRWMNRRELEELQDPTVGSRVPQSVTRALSKALEHGPVMLSIPFDGVVTNLVCSRCGQLARCNRCAGPLKQSVRGELAACGWCGQVANDWACTFCGNISMRLVRVGAQGTAQELKTLFKGVPIVISSPSQPRGIVESVDASPRIVIATPGAEPTVRGTETREHGNAAGYQAVAILDAWTSGSSQALDTRLDALGAWMNTASYALSRQLGGQVFLVGDCDAKIATALVAWDPRILARAENEDRCQTALPPFVCAASVWGKYSEVVKELDALGLPDVVVGEESFPAVLGPIGIDPAASNASARGKRVFEEANDRVRAIVRVPRSERDKLAARLRSIVARRAAHRESGEFRFWISPKDLRER